jgi:monoamine oxidase
MSHSRRDFIKFVVAGSVASGCPVNESLLMVPSPKPSPLVEGEHNEICHQIRDGQEFARPEPRRTVGVVIVGGGAAGLSAAYFLRGKDWLLLEKEDHFGGNAYQEDYHGQPFCTGSAYAYRGDEADQLAGEIGVKLAPISSADPTIINGVWAPETWRSGIDQLPYPQSVRESFKKFRDAMLKINLKEKMAELDAESFSKYTANYAPEIEEWWNACGQSGWGATVPDTSAFVGVEEVQGNSAEDTRVILPGGLGCITHRLVELLQPKYKERMLGDTTVTAVVPGKDSVHVTYAQSGKLTTVSAKAVLMCAPKYITSRLVSGIPSEQKNAMRRIRYIPYAVINMIFDKPIYNRAYDTWCPGTSFTDFVVADWTVRNNPGYQQMHDILTFYTPLRTDQRSLLLDDASCKNLAANVLADFQKLLPEFAVDPIEIRLYRRGHPMYMSTPSLYTKTRVAAAQPMDRLFFGNADSGGPESLISESVRLSRVGAEWADAVLAGKPGARELAVKALAPVPD